MGEARVERISIDGEIVHEHFHGFFNHIGENSHHTPLKRAWSITKAKGHSSIGKRSIRACKSGLFLILGINGNLKVPRKAIKKTIELISR
jgi:hypothetical protein